MLYSYGSGKGAPWHPSAAFHMLRGEMIAWYYALIFYDAITMIEYDLESKNRDVLKKDYLDKLKAFHSPVPEPKSCGGYRCNYRPQCFTDYKPHYSPNSLQNILVGRLNWTYDPGK